MPFDASLPSLAELLKKSREIRMRLHAQAENAAELQRRVEAAKIRMTKHARFSPE